MKRFPLLRFPGLAAIAVALTVLATGCRGGSSTSAQFTASTTGPAPGLVKLVPKSRSGSRVVIDVLIYGPEPALDLYGFRFGIRIGDAGLVRLAAQASYPQTALLAGDGQSIAVDVDGASDPSLVQVDVEKQGGGTGNGIAGASAVVIELPFDLQGTGATALTLVGLGANPPQALDSNLAPIAAVTFDAAAASVRGVSTGGGY